MINKIVHYSWISGEENMPQEVKDRISRWHELLPDYKFINWNTSNFDFSICKYVQQAFALKAWAHASDFIRSYALYHFGGIWLDTDVELCKNLDNLLEYDYIFTNEQVKDWIGDRPDMGAFMIADHHPFMKYLLESYLKDEFVSSRTNIIKWRFENYIQDIIVNRFLDALLIHGIKVKLCNTLYSTELSRDISNVYVQHEKYGNYFENFTKSKDDCIWMHLHNGSWINNRKKYLYELTDSEYKEYTDRLQLSKDLSERLEKI